MLGAKKQKAWLSDQSFAKKYGFETVDATESGYELLALSFDSTVPRFAPGAKRCEIEGEELTVYYDFQCPFILQTVDTLKAYCAAHQIPAAFIEVDTLRKAKELPCVFNNWAVFYRGKLETVNLLSVPQLKKILEK